MTRSRRILFVTEQGVASRYWEAAIPLVKQRGYDPALVTLRERGPLHERLQAHAIDALALDCRSSSGYPGATIALARLIRQRRIDLVHGSEPIGGAIAFVAAALARRGARVYHRHHCDARGVQRALSRVAGELADCTLAVSQASLAHAIADDGVAADRAFVAYNGVARLRTVAADEIAALRARLGIAAGDATVVIVARLRPEKGHRTLFRALDTVAAGLPRALHLVVVGAGPEQSALRAVAAATHGYRIHFAGHQEDIAAWYAIGDVVAVPSDKEPFGLVAIEAQAAGRPVVASRVEGLREIFDDGGDALLVEPGDSAGLAAAIASVLASPSRADALVRAGLARYESRFTLEAMVAGWLRHYESCAPAS